MAWISTILFLMLAVAVSAPLARLVRLPLPLVQIALGATILFIAILILKSKNVAVPEVKNPDALGIAQAARPTHPVFLALQQLDYPEAMLLLEQEQGQSEAMSRGMSA